MLQEKLITFALGGEDWVLWILISLSVLCIGIAASLQSGGLI